MRGQRGVTLIELLVAVVLLSLLSVAVLFGMRIGLNAMDRSNDQLMTNRKVLGVERVITRQISGIMPVVADCYTNPEAPPQRLPFFQGEPETMRFVSSYSMNEAGRGYPRILEYHVIPGENGAGVRLIVNELWYSGPLSAGATCIGVFPDPLANMPMMRFRPVQAGPMSFVLADKLASCRFAYKEEKPLPQPELWTQRWIRRRLPDAIRIDMAPLSADPTRLDVPSMIVPVRVDKNPEYPYTDVEQP